jgi:hypothetical protein
MDEQLEAEIEAALHEEDPHRLAARASKEHLERLIAAEQLLEKRFHRKKRRSRLAVDAQLMVAYVALAGFFVNAYQIWANKSEAQHRAEEDSARWSKEFERAREADRYHVFFETSVLATDADNPDKRLVGYALLKEFVADPTYNSKAVLLLEEALSQELRRSDAAAGLDERHNAAIEAIISALAFTNDCKSLEDAASSVELIGRNHGRAARGQDAGEIFHIYVRWIFGRALQVCKGTEYQVVRRPLADLALKFPELAALRPRPSRADANGAIAVILRDHCLEESDVSGGSDCPKILRAYDRVCTGLEAPGAPPSPDEVAACTIAHQTVTRLGPPPAAP